MCRTEIAIVGPTDRCYDKLVFLSRCNHAVSTMEVLKGCSAGVSSVAVKQTQKGNKQGKQSKQRSFIPRGLVFHNVLPETKGKISIKRI